MEQLPAESLSANGATSLFLSVIEHLPIGVHVYQLEEGERLVFVGANPAADRILGVDHRQFVGKTIEEAFPPLAATEVPERYRRAALLGDPWETERIAYEDNKIAGAFSVRAFQAGPGRMAAAFFDITAPKRAEEALRASEARLSESQHVARIGHYELDVAAGSWTSSAVLDEIFGIDADYVRDVAGWIRIVHPDEREEMGAYFTGEVLAARSAFDREYRVSRISDGRPRWVHGLGRLALGVDGRPLRMFGTIQDVTERKVAEAERQRLEQQLLHTQKLESLGVLAGGIAHDFNNILMSVIGNASLARLRLPPESPVLENLRQIELAANRAADLAKQMLAYSGKGKFVVEPVDLNRLAEEMEHMLRVSVSKKALLRFNFTRPLPAVDADATQLRQVVMNLVINASEAIGERSGVIAVSTGCMKCTREYLHELWLDERLPEGLYVTLEIADSGCGMDRETLARIFDPFFTTKFTGRGLGMAAVLGIVRGHRGAIKIYSEPGRGSTFKVFLPASAQQPLLPPAEEQGPAWRGSGLILLVDDEESVLAIGAEMLRELGFEVVTASDGRAALERYRERRPHLVILDLTMPQMDGEQAFRELRQLEAGVRVIMSSGYNEKEVAQKFAGKRLAGFIQKPYSFEKLRTVLRAALCS